MSFEKLGLAKEILAATSDAGYSDPTPIQQQAIPLILSGRDVIGIAQTGTGKTAAFTLPLLSLLSERQSFPHNGILVLAPTRELVVQIAENVQTYGRHLPLKIATVYGGVGEQPQIKALKSSHITIATPGRLLDLMDRKAANFTDLKHLVLDEADRMLDMGFIPSIRRIIKAIPRKRQTLLFSATLSREIEGLTSEFQHKPEIVEIGRRSNPADTVSQFVYEVPRHLKMPLLVHLLSDETLNMVLVFTKTRHGADRVARGLGKAGISCAAIHSNRSQAQRLRALDDFRQTRIRVLVATDIAARGLDIDGISHVVNFDFPLHPEDYIHRIGRTGRAEAVGDAISFVCEDDQKSIRALERMIGKSIPRQSAQGFDYDSSEGRNRDPERPRGPKPGPKDPNQARKVRVGPSGRSVKPRRRRRF